MWLAWVISLSNSLYIDVKEGKWNKSWLTSYQMSQNIMQNVSLQIYVVSTDSETLRSMYH